MHDFKYKNTELYCEAVKIADIAKKVSTPFYLYSYSALLGHFHKLEKAFRALKPLICYSMKANSNLSLCRALVNAGRVWILSPEANYIRPCWSAVTQKNSLRLGGKN